MKKNHKIALNAGVVLLISVLFFYYKILSWEIVCKHPEHIITIPKGASAASVAILLKNESCLENRGIFKLALTLTMKNRSIRAGRYNLKDIASIGQLVKMITSPSEERIKITLIEGWTIEQFAAELKDRLQIDSYAFIHLSQVMLLFL